MAQRSPSPGTAEWYFNAIIGTIILSAFGTILFLIFGSLREFASPRMEPWLNIYSLVAALVIAGVGIAGILTAFRANSVFGVLVLLLATVILSILFPFVQPGLPFIFGIILVLGYLYVRAEESGGF